VSLYLLAHVSFRLRNLRTLNRQRLVVALGLLPLIPVAREVDTIVTTGVLGAARWALIAFEAARYPVERHAIRHARAAEGFEQPGPSH